MIEISWTMIIWLLPVAGFCGWLYGRHGYRFSVDVLNQNNLHSEYFRGLNYILNEQPDRAIGIFTRILEVNSETVETHLALGGLFRRRGEVDRAIYVHQNLITKLNLNIEQRALALRELGMDYVKSGLLDRAETVFKDLVETGFYVVPAFTELLDIYQQEKDWDNAIKVAQKLESCSSVKLSAVIAQFYCEKAERMKTQGQNEKIFKLLKQAISTDPNCTRANLIKAEIFQREGKYREAISALQQVQRQQPERIMEAIHIMSECHGQLGTLDEFREYLSGLVDLYGNTTSVIFLAELMARLKGKEVAIEFITTELNKRPSIRGVDKFIDYILIDAESGAKKKFLTIKGLMNKLLSDKPFYKCNHCGFQGKSLYWQCPSCKKWDTVKPISGVEGE